MHENINQPTGASLQHTKHFVGLSMLAKQTDSLALVSPGDQKVRLSFISYGYIL